MRSYEEFLQSKFKLHEACGIEDKWVDTADLKPHQIALTKWACRKGRAAIFASTGLGKSRMILRWAEAINRAIKSDVLILSPLAVAFQFVEEGQKIGVHVTHARDDSDIKPGINIINYERIHRIDTERFPAVAFDESSCVKHQESKTLRNLLDAFAHTSYRLPATATPAPNDWPELGQHAELLGICKSADMLSEYFRHDGGETQKWRLMGHAKPIFWPWIASWGAMIQSPSDLDFDGSEYVLPELHEEYIIVPSDQPALDGELFQREARTQSERQQARRFSLSHRVVACAEMVNAIHDEPWIVWCELLDEGAALCKAIPGAVEVKGSDTVEHKEKALMDFVHGKSRVLITKPSIAGFGLNFQHCRRVAFVGINDKWESRYQAIRRVYRFGQKRDVYVYSFLSELERAVLKNIERKQKDAESMMSVLSNESRIAVMDQVIGNKRQYNEYKANQELVLPSFLMN